ncbi:MAG: hypothetical protein IPI03_23740 [Rubrivivax sp.]|nr:hypothetical protein [Rubrivivax sp.]
MFIERVMQPLRRDFPELKVVFEHITTPQAAQHVSACDAPNAATITAHHLLFNRTHCSFGGLRPHRYLLPAGAQVKRIRLGVGAGRHLRVGRVLSRQRQRTASGGAERAVGLRRRLLSPAPAALEPGAEGFDAAGALDKLEDSPASTGPISTACRATHGQCCLHCEPWTLPRRCPPADATIDAAVLARR